MARESGCGCERVRQPHREGLRLSQRYRSVGRARRRCCSLPFSAPVISTSARRAAVDLEVEPRPVSHSALRRPGCCGLRPGVTRAQGVPPRDRQNSACRSPPLQCRADTSERAASAPPSSAPRCAASAAGTWRLRRTQTPRPAAHIGRSTHEANAFAGVWGTDTNHQRACRAIGTNETARHQYRARRWRVRALHDPRNGSSCRCGSTPVRDHLPDGPGRADAHSGRPHIAGNRCQGTAR